MFVHGLRGGNGNLNIWRADAAGGDLKELSNGRFDSDPVCSPDGNWVYYRDAATREMMRVPMDGGVAQKVTDLASASRIDISPDGNAIVFATVDHAGDHAENLALVDTATGKVRQLLKYEQYGKERLEQTRFTPDGKGLVYTIRENGVDNLWQQNLDGSPGKQLTSFKSEHINDFRWSFDGKQLAVVRGHTDSDVVLVRDMQQ